MSQSEQLLIDGPAGKLELAVDTEPNAKAVAIFCHPHSEYGGSMHDMVVGTLVSSCRGIGISCVRFNFRGVGNSEGRFSHGEGEVLDVLAVVSYCKERFPGLKLVLGGYSFGAAISLIASARIESDIAKILLIAPPIQMMESDDALSIDYRVILGGRDTIVSATAAAQYFEADRIDVLPQADHFFADSVLEITSITEEFLGGA